MSNFSIFILKLFNNASRLYIAQRVKTLLRAGGMIGAKEPTPKTIEMYVDSSVNAIEKGGITIPYSDLIDLLKFSDEKQPTLVMQEKCLKKTVTQFFPLVDEEVVESDDIVVLEEYWNEFSKSTVCLKSKTNLSESVYILGIIQIDLKTGVVVETNLMRLEHAVDVGLYVGLDFQNAAKTLAEGIAGMLPPPCNIIGAALISAVWPSASDADAAWEATYQAIESILKNGLAKNKIDLASKKVDGYISFLDNEYKPLKENFKTTPEELLLSLSPYDKEFFLEIVNIFMSEKAGEEQLYKLLFIMPSCRETDLLKGILLLYLTSLKSDLPASR